MKKILSIIMLIALFLPVTAYQESVIVYGFGEVYVAKKGGTLHLRSEATTKSESLGIVHHGDEIQVLALGSEWSNIYSYRVGISGYIKTKYIVNLRTNEYIHSYYEIDDVSSTSQQYALPGTFRLDIDGDGTVDTVDISFHYDEYANEYFRVIFETAYGSSGEATLPFWLSSAVVHFAKFDESGRVYALISGDIASSDFETYIFYVEEGKMKNASFRSPSPYESGIGFAGSLASVDDGIIKFMTTLDVLGTRGYSIEFNYEGGEFAPVQTIYKSVYDLNDEENWIYCALENKVALPYFTKEGDGWIPSGSKLIVTWLDYDNQLIGFQTMEGVSGYFKYEKAVDEYYGITINGVYELDAFVEVMYAG